MGIRHLPYRHKATALFINLKMLEKSRLFRCKEFSKRPQRTVLMINRYFFIKRKREKYLPFVAPTGIEPVFHA